MSANVLLLALGVLIGGFGEPAVAETASSLEATKTERPARTASSTALDTIYVWRMEPLIVIGKRIRGNYAGTIPKDEEGSILLASAAGVRTVGADTTEPSQDGVIEGGLIADNTFSVTGRRFAEAFLDQWTEPEDVGRFTLEIQETPAPQFGSRVVVEIEGTTILESILRPARGEIEPAAQQAARRAMYYLREYYEPREVY